MSDETLSAVLRVADKKLIAARVAQARLDVESGARNAPDQRRVATVVLREGLTGVGIQSLLDLRGLQLASLEGKTPVPATGTTMTVGIGHVMLSRFPGSIRDRVDFAMDFQRERFRVQADRLEGRPEARQQMLEFREVAESPHFAIYALDVVGRREDFRPLLADAHVRAVFVDEDEARVAALDSEPLDGVVRPPGMSSMFGASLAIPTGRLITNRPVKPNPQLAREALSGFLKTSDEGTIERITSQEHARLQQASNVTPEERRAGDVLLRRGLNALEVQQLLSRHRLEYMSCEVKTPMASNGTVMTMWSMAGGPAPRLPGPIAEQVERDISRHRYVFEEQAKLAAGAEDAAYQREAARSPEMGVYRVEVVGTYRDLAQLIQEEVVRGVYAERDGARAKSFDEMLADQRKNMRIIRTRRPVDPNDPLPPPLTPPKLPPR